MDKQTLSHYGWIIIMVLILSVMLAFATPFGTYIGKGVSNLAMSMVGANDNAVDKNNIEQMGKEWERYLGFEFTTLTAKTWNGLTEFYGKCVWTDGTSTYYSMWNDQYVLNGDTWEAKTWEAKTWNGLTSFDGYYIWTDGTNIYCSNHNDQYVLNGDTWEPKTWNGLTSFYGDKVWTDGTNTYYSCYADQYVLNGDTWEAKTWNNAPSDFYGSDIWTDGTNYYYSYSSDQYVLS